MRNMHTVSAYALLPENNTINACTRGITFFVFLSLSLSAFFPVCGRHCTFFLKPNV